MNLTILQGNFSLAASRNALYNGDIRSKKEKRK
jgi:hypothetical protein